MSTILPTHDRVVLELITEEQVSTGGIILQTNENRETLTKAKVVAVGPGTHRYGTFTEVSVKVGDTVVFDRVNALTLRQDNKTYYVVNDPQVMAVLGE